MHYSDLRHFLQHLQNADELHKVNHPVSPHLEMTEISSRVLHNKGPALLFTNLPGYQHSALTNLFGTQDRIAKAMGVTCSEDIRVIGKLLAQLKQPTPPERLQDIFKSLPLLKSALHMQCKYTNHPICQQNRIERACVDLGELPIQTCWPGDAAPLITWPLVITKGPSKPRLNIGIYRMQVIDRNRLIVRWLSHRGGALDYQDWVTAHPTEPFPISVAIGADPATILAAVTPVPDTLSEFAFAGLLRGQKSQITQCIGNPLSVPATAEYILEGHIHPNDTAQEGPFGDHTGYYNEQAPFPVMTVDRITHRDDPIYLSTYTGRPPDEPSVLAMSLNELFIPILQTYFPEIIDFYLPPAGCSYRMAIISIRKQYPGHAKRIMLGIWSVLRQFMYTKYLVVVDEDINIRNWDDVIWAITTRTDPERDSTLINNTPIDYLDFASPTAGLGSKMGLDATNKWVEETRREWGSPISQDPVIVQRIDEIWSQLAIPIKKGTHNDISPNLRVPSWN
ncbi:MAG: UbiD family decarboxylase [Ketobacter sp.]|nr:UbiD family decarboxylase [Ketobacter sp.]